MGEANRVVLVQKSFEERSASTASNQTSEYSNGNFSWHLDTTQGPRLTDSRRESSAYYGVFRQTDMKIKVVELGDPRPPERIKTSKGASEHGPGSSL
ncbi:cell 5A endo-1,4-betaglucanase [Phytophthora cinnamomi]|uniref:cell 5A endo-1,4-betaglucanase n=1 Tax=Phytophthora cinnamomi TaxID=4785 RepID=UPI0035595481|nr:cell 5A endo-1,4-betaglucanase [Phytophthora cinnamomi]